MQARNARQAESVSGRRLVVAGGGTGGHLFPGIAIAQSFKAREAGNAVMFVNAGRPLETRVLADLGWPQKAIGIEGIKGRGLWQQVRAALRIPKALVHAAWIVKRFKPDMVLGVGGYSAGPVVAAAALLNIPTALHEQNRLPGLTNRILGRMVKRIYLTFSESGTYFRPEKVKYSGNPVRNEILKLAVNHVPKETGRPLTVLVVGGSQGAQAINAAVAEALPQFKGVPGIRFVHQTGQQDEPWVQEAYAAQGLDADARAFFSHMAEQYQAADLMICRAGATTVAEITAIGKAAVFVPFPHAADDHQTQNALALSEVGAAELIKQENLSGDRVAKLIKGYMENRVLLTEMAAKARALGHPDAARIIVDDIYALLTQGG